MINEENLNKMYESILKEQELTTKELNECGFNSRDLATLIESGKLERIRRGYYSLRSIDDLFHYGKKLISMEENGKATACFEKCYELEPNHLETCFQLFLTCIQNRNYEKAFEYFERIYNTDNIYYTRDNNFYLYLLSMITKVPENHSQYAKFLKRGDIKIAVNDKRHKDIPAQNNIRILSLNQKFVLALKKINELTDQYEKVSIQDMITITLINQAREEQYRRRKHIIKLVNKKQYDEVIEYLETFQEQHNLSVAERYTLTLAKDLTGIIKTGIIPRKQALKTKNLSNAISGKNYELALKLSSKHIRKSNIEANSNVVYILLTEIQNLIDKKKETSSVKKENIEKPVKIEQEEKKQVIQQNTTIKLPSCREPFADIIGYLIKNDLDTSFRTLRNYLSNIRKTQYEFLIIDLIKISLIEKDSAFTKPMIALTYVSKEKFEFNISEYILNFYESLAQNEFEKARIYLDIISKSNNLGQDCTLTESLETVLNNTEKKLNYQENNELLNKVEQSLLTVKNNSIPLTVESPFDEKTPSTKQEVPSKKSPIKELPLSKNKDYNDYEFINQKLETLYEKGILLLKPMDSERIKGIHAIVKKIPDIASFSIGSGSSEQVVLRFKPYINKYVDFMRLSNEGKEAYKNGDYDTCISAYKQMLEFGDPKPFIYAKLGLAYMKKSDNDTATDYLTVATELSKKGNGKFDFTELIARLNGQVSKDDKDIHFIMPTYNFENDIDDYYGIEQVEQIAELVSSGMTIDEACLNMNLDDEQKSIVALIFARVCYAQENYAIGDQYLKKVEKTKKKSEFVKSLFEEVRKTKKFYKNRVEEGQKLLILTPKTKK